MPYDVARFARLGITASVQYTHATSDRELAARLWADRLGHAYPYRQLLDAGVRLAGGSDAPVEELDPLAGLRAAAECGVSFDEALDLLHRRPRLARGSGGPPRPRSHPAPTPTSWSSTATACARRWSPGAGSTVSRARRRRRAAIPRAQASRSSGAASATRCVMLPEPNEPASSSRPPGAAPGRRSPTSTRVRVLGCTIANCFGRPKDT